MPYRLHVKRNFSKVVLSLFSKILPLAADTPTLNKLTFALSPFKRKTSAIPKEGEILAVFDDDEPESSGLQKWNPCNVDLQMKLVALQGRYPC